MKKAIFLCLLLLTPLVSAQGACEGNNDLLSTLINLPGCISETFLSTLNTGFAEALNEFMENSFVFISSTPDPSWFCAPYNSVMALLETLYSLVLMGVGLYYIVGATNPDSRVKAKEWLKNIFFMILILSFSFNIFGMMISVNTYLTTSLMSGAVEGIFTPETAIGSVVFTFVMLLPMLIIVQLSFFTLLLRYLLIPFMLLLFPFAIFLYFVPLTQAWGKIFLKFIVITIFMTSIDALLVMALSALFSVNDPILASGFIRGTAVMLGFASIGIVNAVLFLTAILSAFSQAMNSMGPVKLFLGGIITKALL